MYLTLKYREHWVWLDVFEWEDHPAKLQTFLAWGRDGAWSHGRIGGEFGTGTHCNPHGGWQWGHIATSQNPESAAPAVHSERG